MAGAALGRAVVVSSTVRGLGLENSNHVPLKSRALSNSSSSSGSSASIRTRGIQSLLLGTPCKFDATTSGADIISNSAYFRRSTQLQRHLNPRPWSARVYLSTNPTAGTSTPVKASFIGELIEKVIQFLARLLPSRALVKQLEDEVDAAATVIEQGVKIVVKVAEETEKLANAAEIGAEEVESIAKKVEEVTELIKNTVDGVADVIDGDKGVSTLANSVGQLKEVAKAKKTEDSAAPATEPAATTTSSFE